MFKKLKDLGMVRISLAREINELGIKDLTEEDYIKRVKDLSDRHTSVCKELSDEINKLREEIRRYEDFFAMIDIWCRDDIYMEWYYTKEKVIAGKGPQDIKDFVNSVIMTEKKDEERIYRLLGLAINKG